MKKIMLSTVLVGSIFANMVVSSTVFADEVKETTVNAAVTEGEFSFTVDETINFGSKPLADEVDFGSQPVAYTVTDFTGNMAGYTLSARTMDTLEGRVLTIGEKELTAVQNVVYTANKNEVGINTESLGATLTLSGVKEAKDYKTTIEWTLTKATTLSISE